MRAYELMVILDGALDDNVVHGEFDKISKQIGDSGGTIATTDIWGRREFAYEINKRNDGHYAVFEVLAAAGALDGLDRQLRLADQVVRHKLMRLPDAEAERRGLIGEGKAPATAGTGGTDA